MRYLACLFLSALAPLFIFAQPKAVNFPNLVVYVADESDPYIEFTFTGSFKKLSDELQEKFRGADNSELAFISDSSQLKLKEIMQPVLTGGPYSLTMHIIKNVKSNRLIQIRVNNSNPEINLLNPKMGTFRLVMEYTQEAIDNALDLEYYDKDQNPNVVYLFSPNENEKNLFSYLFMYSKEPLDTTMKKLSEWFVYASETPQAGFWLNDSTYRIENLKQSAFGSNESFILTISHTLVQDGYYQYTFYLSNYLSPGNENNDQVRPYDIHIRLWHYYNVLLAKEQVSRRR